MALYGDLAEAISDLVAANRRIVAACRGCITPEGPNFRTVDHHLNVAIEFLQAVEARLTAGRGPDEMAQEETELHRFENEGGRPL